MSRFNLLFVLSSVALLAACGTLIEGQTQLITLTTPGAQEARCTLDNGVRYVANTGETIDIMKSNHDLVVDCYATGNRHKTISVPSGATDWAMGNVATGIVPGMAYDHLSGGLYVYPPVITVDFVGMPTYGFDLPDYHDKDAPNPYNRAIEDYGPTTPRIPNDSAYLKRGVEKRDPTMDSNPFATPKTESPAATSPAPISSGPAPAPILRGGNAESLTRSANPHVFSQ